MGIEYKLIRGRGALNEADAGGAGPRPAADLARRQIPRNLLEVVPEAVARENRVLPLSLDGETLTCAGRRSSASAAGSCPATASGGCSWPATRRTSTRPRAARA